MRSHQAFPRQDKIPKAEPGIAESMLALIPDVPDDTSIFVQNEADDPWDECYSANASWKDLDNPITTIREDQIGHDNLRKLAEKGYATVIPYNQPVHSAPLLKYVHQLLAAGPVVYARSGTRRKNLPGLMFHPGNSTLTSHVRGEANPQLGFERLHGNNKWWEWQFVSRIDPTVMPKTIMINRLPVWNYSVLVNIRRSIRKEMEDIVSCRASHFTLTATYNIAMYLSHLFTSLRQKFPNGAFIKPVENSCSGDFEEVITTYSTNVWDAADRFVEKMPIILRHLNHLKEINSTKMRSLLLSQSSPFCLVIYDLLFNPREVIGQKAIPIAKTALGYNFEVRVDFLQGKSVKSMMRFCLTDYYPREVKAAADFLNDFFKKADLPEQLLCGGADLALGVDGKWHIIEFNLGAESIGLKLGIYWNCYVSTILGKNTTLVSIFENIISAPINEQQQFLKGLDNTFLNHPDIDDLRFIYLWFRDRHCQDFLNNPTPGVYERVMANLRMLFANCSDGWRNYTTQLIERADAYMSRELLHSSRSENQQPKQKPTPVRFNQTFFSESTPHAQVKSGTKRSHEEDIPTKRRLI